MKYLDALEYEPSQIPLRKTYWRPYMRKTSRLEGSTCALKWISKRLKGKEREIEFQGLDFLSTRGPCSGYET